MTRRAADHPPAQVEPYVRVLGVDGAIAFLAEFGGAELYLTRSPRKRSRVVRAVGYEKAVALAEASERLPSRVPLAKPWLAAVERDRGLSVADIARKLRASDVAVRGWLKRYEAPPARDPRQTDLFGH